MGDQKAEMPEPKEGLGWNYTSSEPKHPRTQLRLVRAPEEASDGLPDTTEPYRTQRESRRPRTEQRLARDLERPEKQPTASDSSAPRPRWARTESCLARDQKQRKWAWSLGQHCASPEVASDRIPPRPRLNREARESRQAASGSTAPHPRWSRTEFRLARDGEKNRENNSAAGQAEKQACAPTSIQISLKSKSQVTKSKPDELGM